MAHEPPAPLDLWYSCCTGRLTTSPRRSAAVLAISRSAPTLGRLWGAQLGLGRPQPRGRRLPEGLRPSLGAPVEPAAGLEGRRSLCRVPVRLEGLIYLAGQNGGPAGPPAPERFADPGRRGLDAAEDTLDRGGQPDGQAGDGLDTGGRAAHGQGAGGEREHEPERHLRARRREDSGAPAVATRPLRCRHHRSRGLAAGVARHVPHLRRLRAAAAPDRPPRLLRRRLTHLAAPIRETGPLVSLVSWRASCGALG